MCYFGDDGIHCANNNGSEFGSKYQHSSLVFDIETSWLTSIKLKFALCSNLCQLLSLSAFVHLLKPPNLPLPSPDDGIHCANNNGSEFGSKYQHSSLVFDIEINDTKIPQPQFLDTNGQWLTNIYH
jgi:hypothetical protein